jgi:hypothetical protein
MPGHQAVLAHRDQIAQLCLEAGMIMEDASAPLALTLPYDAEAIAGRVEALVAAASRIMALAAQAQALARTGE